MADKKSFNLDIVTPEGTKFSGDVQFALIPGAEGQFGVMAGHAATLAALTIGTLKIIVSDTPYYFALTDGICEIRDNKVTVAVENAFAPADINVVAAENEQDTCLEELKRETKNGVPSALKNRLMLAQAKLGVVAKSHD